LIDDMDANGVERAILMANFTDPLLPVVYTVVGPSFWGDRMYPPGDPRRCGRTHRTPFTATVCAFASPSSSCA
jgi:hypothetical protein